MRGSKLALGLLLAIAVMLPAYAQTVAPGNQSVRTNPACQFYPTLAVGQGSNVPSACVDVTVANGYYKAFGVTSACSSNGLLQSYGNGTTFVGDPDANSNFRQIVSVPLPTPGTTPQPYFCDYNRSTGAFIASGQGNGGVALCQYPNHAEPGGLRLPANDQQGFVAFEFCGSNSGAPVTGNGAWGDANGRNTGSTFLGMPIALGNCVGATDCAGGGTDITSASNLKWIPGAGLSEASGANWGNWSIICGQNTAAQSAGMQVGMQGCYTLRSTATKGHFTVDSTCTSGGTLVQFDFVAAANFSTGCGAGWGFYQNVHGDIMGTYNFAGETAGTTLSVTFPANGAWTSKTCTMPLSGNAQTDASNFVSNTTSNGWTGTGCSNIATYFNA